MDELEKKDERVAIFNRDRWTCQKCGRSVYIHGSPQLAHSIANTKANRKKYGSKIIDHPLNRSAVCCLKCNDKMNIGFNPGECEKLIDRILAQSEVDK